MVPRAIPHPVVSSAIHELDLPRSRDGLNRLFQLIATTTPDLWCSPAQCSLILASFALPAPRPRSIV